VCRRSLQPSLFFGASKRAHFQRHGDSETRAGRAVHLYRPDRGELHLVRKPDEALARADCHVRKLFHDRGDSLVDRPRGGVLPQHFKQGVGIIPTHGAGKGPVENGRRAIHADAVAVLEPFHAGARRGLGAALRDLHPGVERFAGVPEQAVLHGLEPLLLPLRDRGVTLGHDLLRPPLSSTNTPPRDFRNRPS
jgi:hypothetical protein